MSAAVPLDRAWLASHPLPRHAADTDKNSRGRVLVAGGTLMVPGALRLTGEAALRAGAGKLQMATVEQAALALGIAVPEAAAIALPVDDDGEIADDGIPTLRKALDRCDTFILGPGMGDSDRAGVLVEAVLRDPRDTLSLVLDAAAISCADAYQELLRAHRGRLVLTPHHGEMKHLIGWDADRIRADPRAAALEAASRCMAVVALKSDTTVIAGPDGASLAYPGGGVGLATGGSGDVLAGIIGGLLSRGADPLTAAGWGVWLHGEAGRGLAGRIGPIGFLARELLPEIPGLMATASAEG